MFKVYIRVIWGSFMIEINNCLKNISTTSNQIDIFLIYENDMKHIISICYDILTCFNFLLFLLTSYCAVFVSPKPMATFKWVILNELIWSFTFEFIMWMWKPVPLLWNYVAYSDGFFTRNFGTSVSQLSCEIATFVASNCIYAICLCLAYRYWHAIGLVNSHPLKKLPLAITYLIACYIFLVIPPNIFLYLSRIPVEEVVQKLQDEGYYNFEQLLENSPSLFGYGMKFNASKWILFAASLFFSIGVLIVMVICFNVDLYRTLKKNEAYYSNSTNQMQWMFYKAVNLQTASLFVFMLIPVLAYGAYLCVTQGELTSLPIYYAISLQSFSDYLILLYYITPYRMFCKKMFSRIFCKKEQSEILVMPTTVILAHTVVK